MPTRGQWRFASMSTLKPATPAAFPHGADGVITGNAAMASYADTRQGIGSSPSGLPGGGVPHDDEPTSFIKTPRQLLVVVLLGFAVPIVLITLLAMFVQLSTRVGAGSDSMTTEAIEARIRPVAGFELAEAGGATAARSGEEVYKAVCAACHAAGVAGAPKQGDSGAWTARIKQGLETLVASALKGKGAMPPQGGGQFSDVEITKAVVFMANSGGASFEEPKAEGGEGEAKAEGGEGEAKAEGGSGKASEGQANGGGAKPAGK